MLVNPDTATKKRRRVQRACDKCRAKKIKCEEGDGIRCANCIDYNIECTQTEPPKKRGPKSHIDSLQQRVHKMESMLQKIGVEDEPASSSSRGGGNRRVPSRTAVLENDELTVLTVQAASPSLNDTPVSGSDSEQETVPDDLDHVDINAKMQHLSLGHHQDRFFGQASSFGFLHKAMNIRKQLTQREQTAMFGEDDAWNVQPWELVNTEDPPPNYSFPDRALIDDLVGLYFERVNIYFPVLHRPTFIRQVREGLYLKDHRFGKLVLLCLAIASRFSNDPKVLVDGVTDWRSSGWKWFSQVQLVPKSFLRTASLFDVQSFCLASMYLHGASAPQAVWTLVGIGLRFVQERGVHRRKRPDHVWTVEDELWRRTFWALLCLDRICCSILGRPCSIHDEDFDAELPFECDDEYWKNPDPKLAFKQPEGKLSTMAYFIAHIRIFDILAFILRTIYSVGKYKVSMTKLNPKWEEDVMRKIDSALNKWLGLLPNELRWPVKEHGTPVYYQSATLFITYYYVQIQAHRPFIPAIGHNSSLSLPSLLICSNAARSCSHIFLDLLPQEGVVVLPFLAPSAFTAAVFLLLHIWVAKESGLSIDSKKEIENVRHCVRYLRKLQSRYQIVARFCSMLDNLIAQEEKEDAILSPRDNSHPSTTAQKMFSIPGSLPQPSQPYTQPSTSVNGATPLSPTATLLSPFSSNYSPSFQNQQTAYDLAQLSTDPMDLYRVIAGDSAPPDHYSESWFNYPMGTGTQGFVPNFGPSFNTNPYQTSNPTSFAAMFAEVGSIAGAQPNDRGTSQPAEWPNSPLELGMGEWPDLSFRFDSHSPSS